MPEDENDDILALLRNSRPHTPTHQSGSGDWNATPTSVQRQTESERATFLACLDWEAKFRRAAACPECGSLDIAQQLPVGGAG